MTATTEPTSESDYVTISTVVTHDLLNRLREESRRRHCSMAFLIREAVAAYLERR